MAPDDFRRAIDFIATGVLPRMGAATGDFLTVEYLGGEVLVLPEAELRSAVEYARAVLTPMFRGFRDGAQSNLIASPRRILALHDLFDGRVGTSEDAGTGQRRLSGSAELYRARYLNSLETLRRERGSLPGRVIVIDRAAAPHLLDEIRSAQTGGYDLVLRPVFCGGSDDVDALDPDEMVALMERAYALWSADRSVRIDPFANLFERRAARGRLDPSGGPAAAAHTGCPFQSDCAFRSLALDPDGTLHVCQEMADAGNYPLGNAIRGEFDERTWRLLARRSAHLSTECAACPWLAECGGGCMNEAIEAHGDPFARTELCPAWKAIFRGIEHDLARSAVGLGEGVLRSCASERASEPRNKAAAHAAERN